MSLTSLSKAAIATGGLVMAASPILAGAAMAQQAPNYQDSYYGSAQPDPNGPQGSDYRNPPPPQDQGYQGQPYQGQQYQNQPYQAQPYQGGAYPQGAYQANGYQNAPPPPPEPGAPNGYDGSGMPPPPSGYVPPANIAIQRDADARYAYEAQEWARNYCVKSRSNVAAGAIVGGVLGALVGGGLSGRADRGGGVFAGALIGGTGGALVASTAKGDTSPGCPPGYVVRKDAPAYGYAGTDYYYAAPAWYRPWIYTGGNWLYRPYPYHDWYYRTYRAPPGFYHGGPRGPYRGYRR